MFLKTYLHYNVRELVDKKWKIRFSSPIRIESEKVFNRIVVKGRLFELVEVQYTELHKTWDGKKIKIDDKEGETG